MQNNLLLLQPYDKSWFPLGGISVDTFLAEYWQKKPLLIRQAIPSFEGLLTPEELAGLACEENVQSRIVQKAAGRWQLEHGPFDETAFSSLPEQDWTLLVQGVNQHLPLAAELMQKFSFIPFARLDDLMVSFAPDGGGVGPHYDSYDVFLLQGMGKRLWRLSEQSDLTLVPDAPLRILQHFDTQQEYLLEPGDMLYLPPQVAHWGIAVGPCMTYSIGFRAPAVKELVTGFLDYLQDALSLGRLAIENQRYQDPDLTYPLNPAHISANMQARMCQMLEALKWNEGDIQCFLGRYLTEPKSHVIFDRPRNISRKTFESRLKQRNLSLTLPSLMLFDQHAVYLNGEDYRLDPPVKAYCEVLAASRSVQRMADYQYELADLLYGWYQAGYVEFTDSD